MMRQLTLIMVAASVVGLGGCADLDPAAQRAMTGGLAGAGAGALIGSFSGNMGMGAAIGAGLGAAGGFVYEGHVQSRERAFQEGVATGRAQR